MLVKLGGIKKIQRVCISILLYMKVCIYEWYKTHSSRDIVINNKFVCVLITHSLLNALLIHDLVKYDKK